jgi:hypothetical protein
MLSKHSAGRPGDPSRSIGSEADLGAASLETGVSEPPAAVPGSLGEHVGTGGPLTEIIEVLAPPLHARGTTALGQFRRLSDCINLQPGFLVLREAHVFRPSCDRLQGTLRSLLIDKERVALIGQQTEGSARGRDRAFVIAKMRRRLTVVLPGYVVSGLVYLHSEASLDVFLESHDPRFVPMADVEVLSATDGSPVARYEFALLCRAAVIAAPPAAEEPGEPRGPKPVETPLQRGSS